LVKYKYIQCYIYKKQKQKQSNDDHETIWYKFISINRKQTNEIISSNKE